ncbi:hypothetical protein QBC32DRAFT_371915 [Pseudoneurospora amorphoporcata]|uniref:Uncharacterized protein n=1 Tax=Pseudoneurospora amorphoporcata TaxID=241081 RepID=A0AAN6NRF7_9PEZI|nr:hypothetical protein QBC32DRAFT_371915 [Pseudoneurospora amorphoporcata]
MGGDTSPDSPLLASSSTTSPKGGHGPGRNAALFLDPSPSPPSETEDYLAVDDESSDDDSSSDNNERPTKRFGISASLVMLPRILLFVLTLADLITWSVIGRLSRNRFIILSYIELVFMLITNGCFIFKFVRESRPASGRGLGRDFDLRIPRISLAVGDWSCGLGGKEFGGFSGKKWVGDDKETKGVRSLVKRWSGVFIELYLGVTLIVFTKCAFHTTRWRYLSDWRAPLNIGYVLHALILNQSKPLGRRITIEVAYHGVGPLRKDRYIQLPVDADCRNGGSSSVYRRLNKHI